MKFSIKGLLFAQIIFGLIALLVAQYQYLSAADDGLWAFGLVFAPLFVIFVLAPFALRVVIGIESVAHAIRIRFLDKTIASEFRCG